MPFCKRCGETVGANERFCPKCGARLKGSLLIYFLILLGIAVMLATAFFVYNTVKLEGTDIPFKSAEEQANIEAEKEGKKCVIQSGSGLFCDEFTTSATTNTVTIRVKNILTDTVYVTGISMDTPACTYMYGGTGDGEDILADATDDFDLTGCTLTSKDKIKATLTINYKVGTGGLAKSTTGTLVGIVQ